MEFTSEDKEKIEPVHIRDRTLMFQFSDSWVVHEVQDDSTADDERERLLKATEATKPSFAIRKELTIVLQALHI